MKNALIILGLILISVNGFFHGGRTDEKGGHHDRKNGVYHYHHGGRAHQHPNGICELSSKNRQAVYSDLGRTLEYEIIAEI